MTLHDFKNYLNEDKCIINIHSYKDISESYDNSHHIFYLRINSSTYIPFFSQNSSLCSYKGTPLFLSDDNKPVIVLNKINNGFLINVGVDIIYSIFYIVSRQEEVGCKKRDAHNRFPAEYSVIFKEGLLNVPLVNIQINLLYDLIVFGYKKMGLPLLQKCYWPGGKEFAACLTHDVDLIRKWTPSRIKYQFLKIISLFLNYEFKHSIKELIIMLNSITKNKDPYWNFSEIME